MCILLLFNVVEVKEACAFAAKMFIFPPKMRRLAPNPHIFSPNMRGSIPMVSKLPVFDVDVIIFMLTDFTFFSVQ
jgi:hypothetical protein